MPYAQKFYVGSIELGEIGKINDRLLSLYKSLCTSCISIDLSILFESNLVTSKL